MIAPLAAGTAPSRDLVAVHFWHGVEAVSFLAVTLGGVAIGEWWQRRKQRVEARRAAGPRPASVVSEADARRRATLLRFAALSSAAAAAVHAVVMPEHFDESTLYGCFFLVTAIAQFGYAGLILWRPSRALLAAGLVANVAVVGLWLMTRLVAIPLGPAAGSREHFGGLDVLASSFEALFVVLAAVLVVRGVSAARSRRIHRLLLQPSSVAFAVVAGAAIGLTTSVWPPS
jgi:hypothetical protein